jgi:hypothetical protein
MADPRRRPIEHIRAWLQGHAGADAVVSARLENVFFDDGLALEADVIVRRAGTFELSVVEDALPREREDVIRRWLRVVPEVWVVDLRGRSLIARRDLPILMEDSWRTCNDGAGRLTVVEKRTFDFSGSRELAIATKWGS